MEGWSRCSAGRSGPPRPRCWRSTTASTTNRPPICWPEAASGCMRHAVWAQAQPCPLSHQRVTHLTRQPREWGRHGLHSRMQRLGLGVFLCGPPSLGVLSSCADGIRSGGVALWLLAVDRSTRAENTLPGSASSIPAGCAKRMLMVSHCCVSSPSASRAGAEAYSRSMALLVLLASVRVPLPLL